MGLVSYSYIVRIYIAICAIIHVADYSYIICNTLRGRIKGFCRAIYLILPLLYTRTISEKLIPLNSLIHLLIHKPSKLVVFIQEHKFDIDCGFQFLKLRPQIKARDWKPWNFSPKSASRELSWLHKFNAFGERVDNLVEGLIGNGDVTRRCKVRSYIIACLYQH